MAKDDEYYNPWAAPEDPPKPEEGSAVPTTATQSVEEPKKKSRKRKWEDSTIVGEPPTGVEYCSKVVEPRSRFEPDGFQWKRVAKTTWHIMGCPTGQLKPVAKRCKVSRRVYRVVMVPKGKRKKCLPDMRRYPDRKSDKTEP